MTLFNNSDWTLIIGWLGFLWAVTRLIRGATKDFDGDLAPEVRACLTEQLKRVATRDADWMLSFCSIFTRAFGHRHLSWRCFSRSMFLSGVTFALLTFATGALMFDATKFGEIYGQGPIVGGSLWFIALVLVGMTFNGLLDYLSLWQTRLVIRLPMPAVLKVLIDISFTTLIVLFLFGVALAFVVYTGLSYALKIESAEGGGAVLLIFILYGLQFMDFPPRFGSLAFVIFATSFSTSVWLVLHLLSGAVIRWLPGAVSRLNVKVTPVRAIGIVTVSFVWLIGLSIGAGIIVYAWASAS